MPSTASQGGPHPALLERPLPPPPPAPDAIDVETSARMLAFFVCHVIGKLKNASCFELRKNPTMADVLPSCYETLPVSPVDPPRHLHFVNKVERFVMADAAC